MLVYFGEFSYGVVLCYQNMYVDSIIIIYQYNIYLNVGFYIIYII